MGKRIDIRRESVACLAGRSTSEVVLLAERFSLGSRLLSYKAAKGESPIIIKCARRDGDRGCDFYFIIVFVGTG